MNLYKLSENELQPLAHEEFALEKEIQSLIEKNISTLFNVKFVSSEFAIGEFRIDTLCFDEEANSFVIVEYKRGNSYSVVDQGYSYLSVMLNSKADFILEYNERLNRSLKRDEVDWASSRVIFISPSFNSYQKNSVNFRDIPFELWKIKKFSGGIIALEQHQSSSKASIGSISNQDTNSIIARVASEVSVTTEDEHVAKLSDAATEVYIALKQEIEQLSDTTFYAKKQYVGSKKDSTVMCYIHFNKNYLYLDIGRGNISPEGNKSKGFFSFDDPKKIAADKSWTHKDGTTGHYYRIKIATTSDIDYAMYLLKQKYAVL